MDGFSVLWPGRFEGTCQKHLASEQEAPAELKAAPRDGRKCQTNGPTRRYHRRQDEAERTVAEWCRLSDLFT